MFKYSRHVINVFLLKFSCDAMLQLTRSLRYRLMFFIVAALRLYCCAMFRTSNPILQKAFDFCVSVMHASHQTSNQIGWTIGGQINAEFCT